LFSAFLFLFLISLQAEASVREFPFQEGERLLYRAKWGALAAGEAMIETLPSQTIKGKKSCHFVLTAWTSPKIDAFYRLRERQESFTDLDLTRSLLYSKSRTGRKARDVVVDFDWKNMTATSVDSGRPQNPVAITPGTLDPLVLIFSIRTKKLDVGEVLEIPVTDGKRCASVRAVVQGRETLTVDDRTYDTFVVMPDMNTLAPFLKKGRQITLWYSADEQQLPVRMQSRFPIGNFVFELVGIES
jgi:hypothetical protein